MPTFLVIGRYRFRVYSNENSEPAHVHVESAEDDAKFWINPVVLQENHGFNSRELNQIRDLIIENHQELMRRWREWENERNRTS